MNIELPAQIINDLERVNKVIEHDLRSDIDFINQISGHIINAGGKRIRPILTLLCGRISQVNNDCDCHTLYQMATMIEYIHTATLLHDDVVDEALMRRGQQTINALFSNNTSVLVGDFIYTRAFELMCKADSLPLLKIMARATNQISQGEILQLFYINNTDINEEQYFKIITAKTAILFQAAANVATIVNKSSSLIYDALSDYAFNLGIAFQIIDDVLDYTGQKDQTGKAITKDLLEGKITLPIIYLFKNNKEQEQLMIKHALSTKDHNDIMNIVRLLLNSDAITYCTKVANDYIDKALTSLNIFISSEYKTALQNLAKLAINRLN